MNSPTKTALGEGQPGAPQELRPTLTRVLRSRDIALLTLGIAIGSGIFIVPGPVLGALGSSPPAMLAVWIACGVMCLLGALTYAELGSRRSAAGGLYAFLRDAFGRRTAFLFGIAMFFVMGSGTVAALAVAFAEYARELVPLSTTGARVLSAATVCAVVLATLQQVSSCAKFQNHVTVLKIATTLGLTFTLLVLADPAGAPPQPEAAAIRPTTEGVVFAITAVLWAYDGWQYSLYLAGETHEPQRTLPRGLTIGTVLVIAIYVATNVAYLAALGPAAMASSLRTAAEALAAVSSTWPSKILDVIVMIAIVASINGCLLSSSRIYQAMAEDGLFFRAFAAVHPRTRAPNVAVLGTGAWSIALACTGTFAQLLGYVISIGWLFYALSAAALFVMRSRPGYRPAYSVPGYPWTPGVSVAVAFLVVLYGFVTNPMRLAVCAALIAGGLLAYRLTIGRHGHHLE